MAAFKKNTIVSYLATAEFHEYNEGLLLQHVHQYREVCFQCITTQLDDTDSQL